MRVNAPARCSPLLDFRIFHLVAMASNLQAMASIHLDLSHFPGLPPSAGWLTGRSLCATPTPVGAALAFGTSWSARARAKPGAAARSANCSQPVNNSKLRESPDAIHLLDRTEKIHQFEPAHQRRISPGSKLSRSLGVGTGPAGHAPFSGSSARGSPASKKRLEGRQFFTFNLH